MTSKQGISKGGPVSSAERFAILDILRGFALLGIALANFPEFSLYTFLHSDVASSMPTADADGVARFLLYMLVDGKFYTIFSLLFGMGFSIIITHAMSNGANWHGIFYRRMALLVAIGFMHLMLLWSGDILMLYALLGMLLPLFCRASNRTILGWAAAMLLLPVVVDAITQMAGVYLSAPVVELQWQYCAKYGITEENFAYWLRDVTDYKGVYEFLVQGAIVRLQEFIDGNRYFKVFGLFLIGYYLGRNRIYARLDEFVPELKKIVGWGFTAGLPLSVVYALSGVNGHPWGNACHSIIYVVSVYPMGFAYIAALCLVYVKIRDCRLFRLLAASGRMALTCYIGQSAIGMVIFYGIGFGLGAGMGLAYVLAIAAAAFVAEALLCSLWLRWFRFGPLEWAWRMLTYGKYFPLKKK